MYIFLVFELNGGNINSGADKLYYAGVISSRDYPYPTIKERLYSAFLNDMPVGAYITYTLLTPPDSSFPKEQYISIIDDVYLRKFEFSI